MMSLFGKIFSAGVAALLGLGGAQAATCRNPAGFDAFLGQIKSEATQAGVSQGAIAAGLANVTYDPDVIKHDNAQGVFKQTFEQFSSRMVSSYRLSKGKSLITRYRATFDKIESQFGVPPAIIVALWGLETDFGSYTGKFATIRSLATLAFDCRRSPFFQEELIASLKLVQRGDLRPSQMHGAWAGELGQTQFMPTAYLKFAVNYGGGRNLITSAPDVLASTANYLHSYGWQKGQPWDPGTPNFAVIQQWNKAPIYSRTIALFADKLAGG